MTAGIRAGEVLLPCAELDPTLRFFVDRLGFRIDEVYPADAPAVALLSGHGLNLRLDSTAPAAPVTLRLRCADPDALGESLGLVPGSGRPLQAPGGCRIELLPAEPPLAMPAKCSRFVVQRAGEAHWGVGRAGMQYRDLIPGRQGGRFIASHIRIARDGPVPDYVHYHQVRFQMIYCYRGWARLVYEDQGPPFEMQAGDCVLQPPRIRHRVLESGDGLEVVELGCPADHVTCVDHALALPTATLAPRRDFGGQRFVHHRAAAARWGPGWDGGCELRDLGIAEATGGLAGAQVLRAPHAGAVTSVRFSGEFLFLFVLRGSLTLQPARGDRYALEPADACVLADGMEYRLELAAGAELLEVRLPGAA